VDISRGNCVETGADGVETEAPQATVRTSAAPTPSLRRICRPCAMAALTP
jgi:hypothetical protein